jgi:hypothetical protein
MPAVQDRVHIQVDNITSPDHAARNLKILRAVEARGSLASISRIVGVTRPAVTYVAQSAGERRRPTASRALPAARGPGAVKSAHTQGFPAWPGHTPRSEQQRERIFPDDHAILALL